MRRILITLVRSYRYSGSSNSIGSSARLISPSIEGGKSQGRGDGNITLRLDASATTRRVADDPRPVTLVVAVGIVAGEVGEGLSGIGGAEAAAAVGEGAAGLGFFSFEGVDAGGDVGELGVDVVVAAYVRVKPPVLGRIGLPVMNRGGGTRNLKTCDRGNLMSPCHTLSHPQVTCDKSRNMSH